MRCTDTYEDSLKAIGTILYHDGEEMPMIAYVKHDSISGIRDPPVT